MRHKYLIRLGWVLLAMLTLAACGGGGGGSAPAPTSSTGMWDSSNWDSNTWGP